MKRDVVLEPPAWHDRPEVVVVLATELHADMRSIGMLLWILHQHGRSPATNR